MSKVIDEVWRPVPGYEGLFAFVERSDDLSHA